VDAARFDVNGNIVKSLDAGKSFGKVFYLKNTITVFHTWLLYALPPAYAEKAKKTKSVEAVPKTEVLEQPLSAKYNTTSRTNKTLKSDYWKFL
jgi:hypothetical protein